MSLPKRDGVHDRYYLIHKPDTSPELLAEADLCIQDVLNGTAREVPMETVTEVTDSGATKEVERKVFPGYVLIKMVMTDDTWHLVRNVRGVTGFVGSANKAIPLTEEEVLAMGMEKHEIVVRYNVGDHVKIVDGPLASFTGVVEEIEPEKNRVSVMVSMFGRETPVELELDQVEVQD